MPLNNGALTGEILFPVLLAARFGILRFGCRRLIPAFFIRCAFNLFKRRPPFFAADKAGAAHGGNLMHRNMSVQQVSDFRNGVFAHAIAQQVGTGFNQNRRPDCIVPVIIVGKAAKRCFQTAQNDRDIRPFPPRCLRINDDSAIRAQSGTLARRIPVFAPAAFGGRIMCDHRINVAGRDKHAQTRFREWDPDICAMRFRLAEHTDPIAFPFQNAADDGCAKGRMIYIGVSADVEEIIIIPAACCHFFVGYRQELRPEARILVERIVHRLNLLQTPPKVSIWQCCGTGHAIPQQITASFVGISIPQMRFPCQFPARSLRTM